jgi:putative endonuclease
VASWHVYILLCADGTLYTGVTTDPERRLAEHLAGSASRYTRSRGAVRFVHTEPAGSRGQALKREWAIKRLPRPKKLALANQRTAS